MFTDIVGYTALMEESEERGVRERIVEIVRARVAEHGGSLVEVGVELFTASSATTRSRQTS